MESQQLPEVTERYIQDLVEIYRGDIAQLQPGLSIYDYFEEAVGEGNMSSLDKDAVDNGTDLELVIKELLLSGLDKLEEITPWDVEYRRITIFRLPSVDRVTIEVTIISEAESYYHNISEELVYGILLSTPESIRVLYQDVPIPIELFSDRYSQEDNSVYQATISTGRIFFSTPDLVQGIITGATWSDTDPHDYITDIMEQRGDNYVPVTF